MTLLEDIKKSTEKITGWRRPAARQLEALLRQTKPGVYYFRDDGVVPNNPRWPVIIMWRAVRLPRSVDPAAVFEDLFESNGWDNSWRDGIYGYLHYHSRIHEVMGIARGSAHVRLGGRKGRTFKISAGDVVILPAGTGHQCLSASKGFLAVGAYPPAGTYDQCTPKADDHDRNARRVRKVPRPQNDPLSGAQGPLLRLWAAKR
jgi:uncharacterized protein YjlB